MQPVPYNGKSLSEVASAIAQELRHIDALFEDLDAFNAPSECGGDVARGHRRRVRAILAGAGMTAQQFVDAVAERTSSRFAHFSGLTAVYDVDDMEEVGL